MRVPLLLTSCLTLVLGVAAVASGQGIPDLLALPPFLPAVSLPGAPEAGQPWLLISPPATIMPPVVSSPPRTALTGDAPAVVDGNNRFARELYDKLGQANQGNMVVSPYSISSALAMTYAGGRGQTAAEMAQTMHFTLPQEQFHPAFGQLNGNLADRPGASYELAVANRLWAQEGSCFRPDFLNVVGQDYRAPLAQLDFVHSTEPARQTINAWVEQQTHDRIKDLLPPGAVDPTTRMVLTNAIYFNGQWAHEFDKAATHPQAFWKGPDQSVNASMMFQSNQFGYASLPGFSMLEMPYQGGDLSMLAILPDKIDGLPDVEKSLSTGRLDQWTSQLRSREVEVWLPKFQITATFGLAGTLASMGMPTAFSDGADFSGMNDDGGLAINSVIHKAFIDVNEEGTEAAAATAVGISITCAWEPLPPALFCADHPFAFLIRDNVTGSILFMGRVTDPVAAARSASASVPEPATLALLAMAVVLLGPVVRLACRRGSFHKSLFINRLRRSSGGRSVTVS